MSVSREFFVPVFLFIITISATACQFARSVSDPPLPTIVPAKDTATAQPTATIMASSFSATPSPASTETPTTEPTPITESTSTAPAEVTEAVTDTPVPPSPTPTVEPTPPPPPTDTTVEVPPLESLSLQLASIASGFSKPVHLTHANDGSGRIFVVEQAGRILSLTNNIPNATPFLDIVTIVGSDANEQGLLSAAFHPDFVNNGFFFVYYTNRDGNVVVARYQVSENPDIANPDSAQILITIGQPFANHNGGQLVFGPDGYLYIGLGDGGAADDPQNNGQDLNSLLGKILRLDVDQAEPYGVPQTNPFVATDNARPEIWSYGWRNPWRISFDRATGDMYIADVGQRQFEEVHVELAGAPGGQNYGWRLMEGLHCFDPAECDPVSLNLVLPVTEYDHSAGCSITGGHVYRGSQFPALSGIYFYGDFCTGTVWGLRQAADGGWSQAVLLQTGHRISSFGEDEAGEVYLIDHAGEVLQITN